VKYAIVRPRERKIDVVDGPIADDAKIVARKRANVAFHHCELRHASA